MPLVLYSGSGPSRTGYEYDDRTGVSYEFPDRYLSRIVEGERFVYHEPTAYTGIGVVGPVFASKSAGRSVCEILDWRPFQASLNLKDANGEYFEVDRDAGHTGVYWAQGVRSITESSFDRIVRAADVYALRNGVERSEKKEVTGRSAIEQYAVEVVLSLLRAEHGELDIKELPPNNPGFDIRVGSVEQPLRYVNVRATRSAEPVFWLTEGERQFSIANADKFELFVVAGIGLGVDSTAHHVHRHAGAVHPESVPLEPSQWRGKLAVQ